jgi:hypothetical protein
LQTLGSQPIMLKNLHDHWHEKNQAMNVAWERRGQAE